MVLHARLPLRRFVNGPDYVTAVRRTAADTFTLYGVLVILRRLFGN
jgi:hypothetical protein